MSAQSHKFTEQAPESNLKRSALRTERLLRITEAIADAVTSEQIFEALVDRVSETIGASSAGLWLMDDDGTQARLVRAQGYEVSAQEQLAVLSMAVSPPMPVLDCMRTTTPVWIVSQAELVERYPALEPLVTKERAYRTSCLPLAANGRVLGGLAFTVEEERRESEEEREFLLLIGRYATQAIERLRLLNAEKKSRDVAYAAAARVGFLHHASRTFAESGLELDVRLHEVVSVLARTLDSCIQLSLLELDGTLQLTRVLHPDQDAQGLLAQITCQGARPLSVGKAVEIARGGESVLVPDVGDDDLVGLLPREYDEIWQRYPAYSMMGVALRARGRVLGTITATRTRKDEAYTQDDLRLLEELAERAAAAIENSRLYEESTSARLRAEQLYRFAESVVSAERVEEVFDAALVAIAASLGAERSAVLTFDERGVLKFRAHRNLSDEYRRAVEGHCPWYRDAEHPQPVLVPNALADPELASYKSVFEKERIGALAFIPLLSHGRLLGKFMVYHEHPHVFTDSEIDTARALANHLASVVARFHAVAKLEETIRYNELFAGVLAHDLRSPLGAIINAAQLLLLPREGEPALGGRETKPLTSILSGGRRMTAMIEQLLDFTRARSGGGLPVVPRASSLLDLGVQAVSEVELAHPEWTIESVTHGDLRGTWDADRLLQLLINLVTNAGQHGTPGAPVQVVLDGMNALQVRIEIHNAGSVPEPLRHQLFEPFRSMRHSSDRSRGLGLGLFIVREIARGHGGSVEVRPQTGESTTFVVHLPRHCARFMQGQRDLS